MERRWCANMLAACVLLLASCQTVRTGDLLFHVSENGNAITAVTPGMIDHVAIVLSKDSIIEAVPGKGVTTSAIDVLRRQQGSYLIGRVGKADTRQSLLNARQYIGCRYDSLFLPGNADIYCSELVQLSFVDKHGLLLFQPIPMSFHDQTGKITDYWTQFYSRRGLQVPEGKPGTNPGELSQRGIVSIKGRLRKTSK